jgi:hypothetical protein
MAQRCTYCGRTKAKHKGPDGKYRACFDVERFKQALKEAHALASQTPTPPVGPTSETGSIPVGASDNLSAEKKEEPK